MFADVPTTSAQQKSNFTKVATLNLTKSSSSRKTNMPKVSHSATDYALYAPVICLFTNIPKHLELEYIKK